MFSGVRRIRGQLICTGRQFLFRAAFTKPKALTISGDAVEFFEIPQDDDEAIRNAVALSQKVKSRQDINLEVIQLGGGDFLLTEKARQRGGGDQVPLV